MPPHLYRPRLPGRYKTRALVVEDPRFWGTYGRLARDWLQNAGLVQLHHFHNLAKTCSLRMRATLAAWKLAASNTGNGHQDSKSSLGIASKCKRELSLQCVYRHSVAELGYLVDDFQNVKLGIFWIGVASPSPKFSFLIPQYGHINPRHPHRHATKTKPRAASRSAMLCPAPRQSAVPSRQPAALFPARTCQGGASTSRSQPTCRAF